MPLRKKYYEEIVPKLQKELDLKNQMAVPMVKKVIVGMGVGGGATDKKLIEAAALDLGVMTGQKAKVTQARASIAGFKIRQGDPIGVMVTLRGQRMYDFLEKLFNVVLPRLRDFQGLSLKSFDGRGGYTLGITEQVVFPEIDYAKVDKTRSLAITIVTNAQNKDQAQKLLTSLGMPFEK